MKLHSGLSVCHAPFCYWDASACVTLLSKNPFSPPPLSRRGAGSFPPFFNSAAKPGNRFLGFVEKEFDGVSWAGEVVAALSFVRNERLALTNNI